jgi:prepilin-type N-terminal cleavage/methylation domain-containing protein
MPAGGTKLRTQTHMRRFVKSRNQSGVTLVELIVVIVIIAVVATLALMQGGSANSQLKRQNIATQLKTAFERARFDSVNRRADDATSWASVAVTQTTFTLSTFEDQGGTMTAVPITTGISGQNISIAGYESQAVPVTIYFNRHGEPVDDTGASISPVFYVCNGSCGNSPTNSNANLVLVTPTGTVNLLGGSNTPPNFNSPGVTNIPSSTGVNPLVSVP